MTAHSPLPLPEPGVVLVGYNGAVDRDTWEYVVRIHDPSGMSTQEREAWLRSKLSVNCQELITALRALLETRCAEPEARAALTRATSTEGGR